MTPDLFWHLIELIRAQSELIDEYAIWAGEQDDEDVRELQARAAEVLALIDGSN
jgi:hypothetical protein